VPTIGVAIALPEPFASDLRRHRASFGDPTADSVPTHLTLLPPTDVTDAALPDVAKHLEEVAAAHSRFELHLRGSATFRPVSPVVFVAVVGGISQCELLAADVRTGPLQCDLTFPFHPHVTVAHDLPGVVMDRAFAQLATYECRFSVDAYALFRHDPDRGWLTQYEFSLAAAKARV